MCQLCIIFISSSISCSVYLYFIITCIIYLCYYNIKFVLIMFLFIYMYQLFM